MSNDVEIQGLPSSVPPPGAAPARRRRRPGRSIRRPEEDVPGDDYMRRMEHFGPREGETLLAFRIRLAGILEGRKLILAAARRSAGNVTDVCRELGVGRHNIPSYLRTCGLQTKDILDCRPENVK